MKKLGVFGGTFNPPHIGHLQLAQELKKKLKLDEVLIIPDRLPPHKNAPDTAPEHRLAMARLAFKGYTVSDLELKREGKSYTADTLDTLAGQYPDTTLYLICGSDMFYTLGKWHDPKRIFSRAIIATGARRTMEYWKLYCYKLFYALRFGARCRVCRIKPLPLSSSQIRQGERNKADIRAWVTPEVYHYIQEQKLYDGENDEQIIF